MSEIDDWGEPTDAAKQKDALIRELVGLLTYYADQDEQVREALAKAKEQGYEP